MAGPSLDRAKRVPPSASTSPIDLRRQVHDALAHLYDLPFLQTNPLAGRLPVPGPNGHANRAAALQRLLIEAVDSLRLRESRSLPSRNRAYLVLHSRYVEAEEISQVCARLGVSPAEYYRVQRRALEAVASVVEERLVGDLPDGRLSPGKQSAVHLTAGRPGRDGHLPVILTSFVGRTREMARLQAVLERARLVTLTGSPGTGKSRLAIEAARQLVDHFADGVHFTALAAVDDPTEVLPAIAQTLGIASQESASLLDVLVEELHERQMLLILDNLEQVTGAGPTIGALVGACPGLRVLATSRAPLRVRGEQELPVPPLDIPDDRMALSIEHLEDCDSTALFVERTRAVRPDFQLTTGDAAVIAAICRRLGGLPLAIELAAARMRVLAPTELLRRLEDQLAVLVDGTRDAPDRHRTMRAAIHWSHHLFDERTRRLFRRLAVFPDGFTLAAVEGIAYPTGEASHALDDLTTLVTHGLVQVDDARPGATRFRMLEVIRAYAEECLEAAGEESAIRRAHATYYLRFVETAWREPRHGSWWFGRLLAEDANIAAMVHWYLQTGDPTVVSVGGALNQLYGLRGRYSQGREYLRRLAALPQIGPSVEARVDTLAGQAKMAFQQGDLVAMRTDTLERLRLSRRVGYERGTADALFDLGHWACAHGAWERARAYFLESLNRSEGAGLQWCVANALNGLGVLAERQEHYAEAADRHRAALQVWRTIDEQPAIGFTLCHLGDIAYAQGDITAAQSYLGESLANRRALDDRLGIAYTLRSMGRIALRTGRGDLAQHDLLQSLGIQRDVRDAPTEIAVTLLLLALADESSPPAILVRVAGLCAGLHLDASLPLRPLDQRDLESALRRGRERLNHAEYVAAWVDGLTATLDEGYASPIVPGQNMTETPSTGAIVISRSIGNREEPTRGFSSPH